MDETSIIAKRIAQELKDGDVVNLGIGIPTEVVNYIPPGIRVFLQSENGILGVGPTPPQGMEDKDIALWELYTRTQFEADIQPYVLQVETLLMETLAASGLEPGSIDAVVKTGGSSNIPLFNQMLNRIFGAEKVQETNAFSSVVAGLAISASRK